MYPVCICESGEVSTGDSSPLPDKDHDDTSTINNDDVNDVTINNENDAIVGQFVCALYALFVILPLHAYVKFTFCTTQY